MPKQAKGRRRASRRPGVERLESRQLLALTIAEYPVPTTPTGFANPAGLVSFGGKLWFTEQASTDYAGKTLYGGAIGSIDPTTKAITLYTIPVQDSNPAAMVVGQDGDLWFADYGTGAIGQFDPTNHAIVEYPTPTGFSGPLGMVTVGGKIWFTEVSVGQIGSIDPATHAIAEYHTGGSPAGLALGADGNLYFTAGQLGQFNPTTHATAFFPVDDPPINDGSSFGPATIVSEIAPGPDGGLYYGSATPAARGAFLGPIIHEIGPTRTFPLFSGPSPGAGGATGGLVAGPDGLLYYTSGPVSFGVPSTEHTVTQIGSLDPSTGAYTTSATFAGDPTLYPSIVVGPDGNLWFTTGGYIGEATIIPANQAVVSGVTTQPVQSALPRQLVYVDVNGNGAYDPGDPSTVSGLDGSFSIAGVPVGTYNVDVQAYPGSTTAAQSVTTTGGQETKGVVLVSHISSVLAPVTFGPAPFGSHQPNVITAEVAGLYNLVLGRAPDAPGLASWVGAIQNGTPFSSVVNAFLHSTAYYDRVVAGDYEALAGRAGSQAEIDAWVALLQQGYTEEQVATLMLSSDGFNSLHPDGASFIQALYNDLLGRQATSDEVASWAAYLAGTSRSAVVAQFVNSDAAKQRANGGFLDAIWGGIGDQAGLQAVVAATANGESLSAVEAIYFNAQQYVTYAKQSVG